MILFLGKGGKPMHTAIYGTLGPSCSDADTLTKMTQEGMTGLRLNLSHTTLREAEPLLAAVHEAERRSGKRLELLLDMQGPELRIGRLAQPMMLTEGERVRLGEGGIPLPEEVLRAVEKGQILLLDDGKLRLRAESAGTAAVEIGGTLRSRKSVALPGKEISLPAMTAQDRENLMLAPSCGVTAVMQPFVRSAEDLRDVRAEIDACGGSGIRLFAKIENRRGLDALPTLLPHADEIVIARGDLGNAVPLWELPVVQKRIAALCREHGVPFMVVTQMLASMEHSPVPTRAEVSDICNAVLDGASSVMVTGETAAGEYPVEVIRFLANTVREAEAFLAAK